MSEIRLQKYIADCGVTSRRKAEVLITEGKVEVNGKRVTELGTKVNPHEDVVLVNGDPIDKLSVDHMYIVLNKPRGVVTTLDDPEGRLTVRELIPQIKKRIYPVGRLDYLSEGLLLMTNDGELANMVMHPKYEVVKTYEVKVFGRVTETLIKTLKAGVQSEVGFLKPKSVRVIEVLPGKTWIEFRLNEGKNREIRRLCEEVGLTIDKLRRVAIGGLSIDGVKPGEWTFVPKKELLKLLGFNKDGTKVKVPVAYISRKKSVDLLKKSKKYYKGAKLADSSAFTRYRKDEYYKTLEHQKEEKLKREYEAAQAQATAPRKPNYRSR